MSFPENVMVGVTQKMEFLSVSMAVKKKRTFVTETNIFSIGRMLHNLFRHS